MSGSKLVYHPIYLLLWMYVLLKLNSYLYCYNQLIWFKFLLKLNNLNMRQADQSWHWDLLITGETGSLGKIFIPWKIVFWNKKERSALWSCLFSFWVPEQFFSGYLFFDCDQRKNMKRWNQYNFLTLRESPVGINCVTKILLWVADRLVHQIKLILNLARIVSHCGNIGGKSKNQATC